MAPNARFYIYYNLTGTLKKPPISGILVNDKEKRISIPVYSKDGKTSSDRSVGLLLRDLPRLNPKIKILRSEVKLNSLVSPKPPVKPATSTTTTSPKPPVKPAISTIPKPPQPAITPSVVSPSVSPSQVQDSGNKTNPLIYGAVGLIGLVGLVGLMKDGKKKKTKRR